MARKVYIPTGSKEIRDQILSDVELAARLEGIEEPPIHPGTDLYLRADATAKSLMLCHASLGQRDAARRVNDANAEELEEMRKELGLPRVAGSTSSGSVIVAVRNGAVTIPDNVQFLFPNNKRGRVSGTHTGVRDGDSVKVESIDTGLDMNLAANETIRFVNPPNNVEFEAHVDPMDPIMGGLDEEDEARKRDRILNRQKNSPFGFNWAEAVEIALNATPAVQHAFVYPALGGPGSAKLVIMKAVQTHEIAALESFSRAAPEAALTAVRGELFSRYGAQFKLKVDTVADTGADVSITVDIPDSEAQGGDGTGWIDAYPWPQLVNRNERFVYVKIRHSPTSIVISAETTAEPPVGNTIAWWSPNERRFYTSTIVASTGGPGNWQLTLNDPLVDGLGNAAPQFSYISPGCTNIANYGESWRTALASHGPGEMTSDANRLPVSLRRPQPNESSGQQLWPYRIGAGELCVIKDGHDEILDATFMYRSPVEAAPPGTVAGRPQVLVPRHFGIYKKGWWEG